LELEDGDIRHAQNFLEQAAAINASDPLVETALAHMHLRKAIVNPAGPDAEKLSSKAFDTLRRLSAVRGASDYYPAHVLGSQALAWCRRATLTPRARTALLREAKEIVGRAISTHRMKPELRQLLDDLTREELQPR
jgi:methylase of polypeptide subunit release factors